MKKRRPKSKPRVNWRKVWKELAEIEISAGDSITIGVSDLFEREREHIEKVVNRQLKGGI